LSTVVLKPKCRLLLSRRSPDAHPAESGRALVLEAGAVRRPLGVSDGLAGEDGDAVTDGLGVDEAHRLAIDS
jgi:hypothetical protein